MQSDSATRQNRIIGHLTPAAFRKQSASWTDNKRFADLVANAQELNGDCLVLENDSGVTERDVLDRAIKQHPTADAIVIHDPSNPARSERLRNLLPPLLNLVASLPVHDLAVVLAPRAIASHKNAAQQSETACEFVVRLAETGTVAFFENSPGNSTPQVLVPKLTTPSGGTRAPWLRQIIDRVKLPGTSVAPTNLAALKAGLYLLNDFFDESHSCSQSIEGLGANHTGDYWHAILHRREPDYGNSKYWFRHVGRHPAFGDLAQAVQVKMSAANGTLAAKLDQWRPLLVSHGAWDPFAFVDLCAAAETDSDLKSWCEQVQFEEMLLLLEATYREAM